jgi:hypothetical protein
MNAIPDYGWPAAIVAILGVLGLILTTIQESRRSKKEANDKCKQDRKDSAEAGDLDIEHLDRERLRRMQK